jgi:hypothetical protein
MSADSEVFDAIDQISVSFAVGDDESSGVARGIASVRN